METIQKGYRYLMMIQFKGQEGNLVRYWDIVEEFKTLREAESFKVLIDDSVSKARIVDCVTEKDVWSYVGSSIDWGIY